jgi:hypothetical protein
MKVRFPLFAFASCAALVATVVLAAPGHAAPAVKPCTAPQNRQFDFWVVRWRVTDAATKKFDGTNEITRELNGCVLQEHWKGTGGSAGTSYNLYDASRKRWHQTWVDNSGGILQLDGGLKNGSMVLEGARPARGGKTVLDRITWTPRPDGSVRQWWQASRDGGATWTTQFDGVYRRAA